MISVGTTLFGCDIPTHGRIRNLNVYQSGTNQVECLFEHEQITDTGHALTYLNGELSGIDTDGVAQIPNLAEGNQNVNVIPQLESDAISPIYFDEQDGQRVRLRWAPSTIDIAGYNLYQTDLDGTNPVLIEQITKRELERATLKYPTTGTGAGRISTPAWPLPDESYGSLTITITGAGEFSYTIGPESGTGTFAAGSTVYLDYGIGILFYDDPAEYVTADTYQLAAGPRTYWLSDQLDPGEYRYGISAFTEFDDESSITLSQVYEIVQQAVPITPTVTWNEGTRTITIDVGTQVVAANLYTNYYPSENYLSEYVSLTPQYSILTSKSITFGEDIEGEFLFYVRSRTPGFIGDGDQGFVELQDYTLYSFTVPVDVPDTLSEPTNLTGQRVGTLQWEIAFEYFAEEEDDCTQFTVHKVPSTDPFTHDLADTVTTITATHAIGLNQTYTFESTAETMANTWKVQVLAHSSTGEIAYSDVIEITTEAFILIPPPANLTGGTA